MKKQIITIVLLAALTAIPAIAADEQLNWAANQHYETAQNYFKNSEYTKAIDEYKKALRINPNGFAERAGLINSYLARSAYFHDQAQEYDLALNDLRCALFFLKYYTDATPNAQMQSAIQVTEENLAMIMKHQNISTAPKDRFATAKQLRNSGNFAAAANEYMAAAADRTYAKESYEALGDIATIFKIEPMAIKYYAESLKVNDLDANVHLKIAKLLDSNGASQAATTHYNYAMANCNNSSDILNSLEKIWLEKITQSPNDAEAQANLGAVYQRQGNYQMALAQYQKAENLNPTNINTRLNMGTLYQIQENYPMAFAAYDSILQIYPDDAHAHYYKAQCLKAIGNTDLAIEEYKTALSLNGNIKTAKSELLSLLKETKTPQQMFEYMRNDTLLNANNADSYYMMAYDLHTNGKLNDAIVFYNEAIRQDASYTDAYINLAQVYKQLKQYENAKAVLTQARNVMPSNQDIQEYYASLDSEISHITYHQATKSFEAGNYQKAIEQFSAVQPQTTESLIGLAACYQKIEDYNNAIAYYKKAFLSDPKNAEIAYYIAMLSFQQDNTIEAKTFAQKALDLNPANTQAKEIIVSIHAGETAEKLNAAIDMYDAQKYDSALSILNEVISKDSKNSNAYFYRAMIKDAKKMYAEAIPDYQKAYDNNKDLTISKYSMAVDYDNLKKYKEAYNEFKNFVALTPQDNEYTKYAKGRINDLKEYENKGTAQ